MPQLSQTSEELHEAGYQTPSWAAEAIAAGKDPVDVGRVRAWKNSIISTVALSAGLALGTAAGATETTAECQARIVAEYDAKIAKAQAEGEAGAKKVALFTRKKGEFVESCNNKDIIAANKQEIAAADQRIAAADQRIAAADQRIAAADQRIAAADQRIAANRQEIAAADQRIAASEFWTQTLNAVRSVLDKVITWSSLTQKDISILLQALADIENKNASPSSAKAIRETVALIEQKTNQPLRSTQKVASL